MKITAVNTEIARGGAAFAANAIAQAINGSGKAQVTLYHCGDGKRSNNVVGLSRLGARQLNALISRIMGSARTIDFGVARQICHESQDSEILHVHNLHGYYLDYADLFQRWGDRPIIWTWHDIWGATGRCAFTGQCELWKTGCKICPNKRLYPAAWVDRASLEFKFKTNLFLDKKNLWITSPSDWVREIAIDRGYPENRVCVIPNPVGGEFLSCPDKDEARRILDLPCDAFVAIFVASDCADLRKGYIDFSQLVEQSNVLGIAIGDPPKKLSQRIVHTGQLLRQQQLTLHYSAADLLVIPSYDDNYPNTVIEAITCGTPVVGYATGGIPAQTNAPFCSVVRTGDKAALLRELLMRKKAGPKSRAMAATLQQHGAKRWGPDNIAAKFLDLYYRVTS